MSKRIVEVQKFGGTEALGKTKLDGDTHEVSSIEAESKTRLQDDVGVGDPAIIRRFTFGANPEAFKQHKPTTQELFNYHHKGIDMALFKDGMRVVPEINPRVVFDAPKGQYHIFVTAKPMSGFILHEKPQTLSEIANG